MRLARESLVSPLLQEDMTEIAEDRAILLQNKGMSFHNCVALVQRGSTLIQMSSNVITYC